MKKDVLLKQIATKLFYEQGWVLTSVAEICRVADVSRVTFYKYFPTKQALVKYKNFINAARFYGNVILSTSFT